MEIEIILKMLLAAVLGGIIGLEQEISHQKTGLKVNVLIALTSALLTALSLELANASAAASHTTPTAPAMIGHLITALGLIGAGIIVKERFTRRGLSTTGVVWSVGAVGMTVGSGYYLTAFIITIFIVIGLILLKRISSVIEKQSKIYSYMIATEDKATIIIEIKKIILDLGISYFDTRLRKTRDGYEIEIALTTSQNKNKEFIERVMHIPEVNEITDENL